MIKVTNYDELLEVIQLAMSNSQYSQTELAKGIGVTQPYINRLLRRKNSPSIDVVFKILSFLDIKTECKTLSPL